MNPCCRDNGRWSPRVAKIIAPPMKIVTPPAQTKACQSGLATAASTMAGTDMAAPSPHNR